MAAKKKPFTSKARKTRKKGSGQDAPLPSVISLRISSQEKRMLERLARSSSRSVSAIMREAMDAWKANQQGLCSDI